MRRKTSLTVRVGILLFVTVSFASGFAWSAAAASGVPARSLFSIMAPDENSRGTGFAIARHGWLLTNAGVVGDANVVTASNKAFGTVRAKVVAVDKESDLALLRIAASPAPLKFAIKNAKPGDIVSSVAASEGAPAMVRGALSEAATADENTVTHNALFDKSGYGGPLVNECGDVIGVDRTDPSLPERLSAPRGYAIADTPATVKAFVANFGIVVSHATRVCVPAVVLATKEAKASDIRAQAAESAAAASQQASLIAQRNATSAKIRATKADAATHKAQAQALQRQQSVKRIRRLSLWGAVAAAALLLLVGAVSTFLIVRSRRRRRDAEAGESMAKEAAARATTPPPGARDLLLEGRAPDGERFAIKIPALALGEAHSGAVIGRNPGDAEFIVNNEKVSRKHCRLFVKDMEIVVEDLGSTNGTQLNGEAVRGAMTIQSGDIVNLGGIPFTVRFRS